MWARATAWACAIAGSAAVVLGQQPSPARAMFEDGVLPSGRPIEAQVANDVRMTGRAAACASCHRSTGLGSFEGGVFSPPIAGGYRPGRANSFVTGLTLQRLEYQAPKYTPQLFARAVREGIDPSGRQFDKTMPRYRIDDNAMRLLTAYVTSLPGPLSPGVTSTQIHLATIVDLRVTEERRRKLLQVLERYVQWRNRGLRPAGAPPGTASPPPAGRPPGVGRPWTLHVWTVDGPPDGWAAQLERQYRDTPVFAVVSGLVAGPWQPVASFCETEKLPCLFPATDLPSLSLGRFSLYFSRGMALEADLIAKHLREQPANRQRVVQVFTDDEAGRATAAELRAAFARAGLPVPRDVALPPGANAGQRIPNPQPPIPSEETLVAWVDARRVAELSAAPAHLRTIFLSSTLLDEDFSKIPATIRSRVLLAHPFYEPGVPHQRAVSARDTPWSMFHRWSHQVGIQPTDLRLQSSAYGAALILENGLMNIGENFYREYLLESLEHDVDTSMAPTFFPRLTLGPGQRFASKQGFILGFSSDSSSQVVRVAGPIVPE